MNVFRYRAADLQGRRPSFPRINQPGVFSVPGMNPIRAAVLRFLDGISYGVWFALIFSVVGLVLTFSVFREDTR